MKKIIIFIVLLLSFSINVKAYDKIAFYIDNTWGDWRPLDIREYGSADGFKIYFRGDHPSNYVFRFQIEPSMSQKELKSAIKSQKSEWGEFHGSVEYYISDEYPDAESQYRAGRFVSPTLHNTSRGETPCKLVRSRATIRVHKFSKHAQVYNIYFDGVGIAISLDGYFDN